VLVVAFGAAIKPLAADDLAGPFQVAKYITLAIVPMLQFALPFSAGFAATLVMHRYTADNEVLAASVSGLSYRRILLPIFLLGCVLLVIMVLLTQSVIPRFWQSLQQMIARDVTRLIHSSIEKGTPVRFGNVQIHADSVMMQEQPPDTGAQTRLFLQGVVAAKIDSTGRIVWDVVARQAVVDVHRIEGETYLKIALADTVGFDAETGQLASAPQIMNTIAVPNPFYDDPRFMTRARLLELRDNPDDFASVIDSKENLAEAIRHFDVWNETARQLEESGFVTLSGGWSGGNRRLEVVAGGIEQGTFTTPGSERIEIREFDVAGRPVRRIDAVAAALRRSSGATLANPTVDLVLHKCEVIDLRPTGVANARELLTIPNLWLATLTGDDPSLLPYEQLIDRAATTGGPLEQQVDRVRDRVGFLERSITSRLLRRYALSATAMLLLLLGATLAIWLRHSQPLVVYIWAFLPSVVDMMLIASGDHMARAGQVAGGLTLMWSGPGLLLAALAYVYFRLSRN
jgi:lipopolysaccharide export LptBFGC system permease protein LptF